MGGEWAVVLPDIFECPWRVLFSRWKGKETARLGGDGMKKRFFPRTKEEEDSLQIIKSLYRYLPYTINHFVHDRVETLRCTTLREHQSL